MKLSHIAVSFLYIFALINTLHAIKSGSIGRLIDLSVVMLLLFTTIVIIVNKRIRISRIFKGKYLFVIYLITFLIISLLSAGSSLSSLVIIIAYALSGILSFQFCGYFILKEKKLFNILLKSIIYCSVFVCFTVLVSWTGLNSFAGLSFSEKFGAYSLGSINASAGILEHPNTWGTLLVFSLGALRYLKPEFNKFFYWTLFGSFVFFLFATFTRGPWLAFAMAYIFMNIYDKIPRWGFYTISVFILILLSFTSLPQFTDSDNEVINSLFRVEKGLSGREVMWPFAFSLIMSEPITGYGFKSSVEVKQKFGVEEVLKYAPDSAFHNSFITMAVELGLIVSILYLIVFFKSFDNIYKSKIDIRTKRFLIYTTVATILSVMVVDYNIGGLRSVSLLLSIFLGAAYQSKIIK